MTTAQHLKVLNLLMSRALHLPQLRHDQYEILKHPAKIKTVCCGRRWGKSVTGGSAGILAANLGGRVAWVTPTYKNGRPLWRWLEQVLRGIDNVQVSRSERVVTFPSGGFLAMYSGDSPDSIRSENFHLVILDEAAKLPEEMYTDAIMPTVADTNGDILMLTTPRGKNWFYYEYMRALANGAAWQRPSSDNPNPNIRNAFDLAKERTSQRTFQQEWLAQFADDGGGVFRGIDKVAIGKRQTPYKSDFVMGIDWARTTDFTVISVIDKATHVMVDCDRFNQVSWSMQRNRVAAMYEKWQPSVIHAEENSIGSPNIEALQNEGLPVRPFTTTAKSKPALIEAYALAIEKQDITLLDDPEIIAEHNAYELKRMPSGAYTYNAPQGMHDDTVIATALAWHGCNQFPLFLFDNE